MKPYPAVPPLWRSHDHRMFATASLHASSEECRERSPPARSRSAISLSTLAVACDQLSASRCGTLKIRLHPFLPLGVLAGRRHARLGQGEPRQVNPW